MKKQTSLVIVLLLFSGCTFARYSEKDVKAITVLSVGSKRSIKSIEYGTFKMEGFSTDDADILKDLAR